MPGRGAAILGACILKLLLGPRRARLRNLANEQHKAPHAPGCWRPDRAVRFRKTAATSQTVQNRTAPQPSQCRHGSMCAAVIQTVEAPLTRRIAHGNAYTRRGIAAWLPRPLRAVAGFVLMDYTFYLWHIATHKSRFLWRFHRVHHIDPDMDSSTAVRFHAVDMLVSLPWRLLQVRCSGIGPATLSVWRTFFNASILFHHSNLQLPRGWDRSLSWLLTTPKMHGIHHSIVPAERDSNWSSGLSLWDRLHGTYREDAI